MTCPDFTDIQENSVVGRRRLLPQPITNAEIAEIARARERDAREEKAVSGHRGARRLSRDPLRYATSQVATTKYV